MKRIGYQLAIAFAIASLLGVTARAQITNGSFEFGLSGWNTTQAVVVLGPGSQPQIGTDGTHVANIGAFDSVGAALYQTFHVTPGGQYLVNFDTRANGTGTPGLTSVVQVIAQAGTQILASLNFTDISPAQISG